MKVHDFSAPLPGGAELALSNFKGQPLLIVNTASKCGFTPQYEGLEALHRTYGPRGLVVLGFPCDQFAHQEPGSDDEIQSFCKLNYGVSFRILSKIEVNGPGTHPLFAWLRSRKRSLLGNRIKWNFTKFLVSKDGLTVRRYAPTVQPSELESDIERALAE